MNRKLKRNFLAVFSGSLALFLFLTGLIFYRRFLPLRDVKVFEFRDGMVLGINEDGFDSELFLVSAETEEGYFLRRVHLENDGNRTVLDAVCAEDGSVLFLEELLYIDGTSTDRVYSWIPGERPWPRLSLYRHIGGMADQRGGLLSLQLGRKNARSAPLEECV